MKMKKFGGLLTITLIVLTLTGCDVWPFQSVETKRGNLLILNKATGSVSKVTDDGLFELESISVKEQKKATLPRTFSSDVLPGSNIGISLKCRYLEGKLLYKVTLYHDTSREGILNKKSQDKDSKKWNDPIEINREDPSKRITIEFTDKNGFTIIKAPVALAFMTRLVDDGNVSAYSRQGEIVVSYPIYRAIDGWNFIWNFDYKGNKNN